MTAFEAGFLKYAEEYGIVGNNASHMLKRALEYPGAEKMFKELPDDDSDSSALNLEALKDLLEQHYTHETVGNQAKQINL